ncbi:ABC transporter permease [Sinimarinibacterium thermocellulolyticum]|uniref:ABC transporter permease n=1 Tax=Sinimarinibacterium thermocellulolyticum TaxID=3170016 RepID=A0ABV2ADX6_9GAMM
MTEQVVATASLPPRRRGRSSLEVFLTSLQAFMLRELKNQFGRMRLGYFWAFAEPAAMVALLTVLHAGIRGGHASIYGESPVIFFVFGAVPYFLFSNCVSRAQGVCESLKGLFNYRQIKPIDVILARCLIDAILMSGVGLLFVAGWAWSGREIHVEDPLRLVAGLFSLFALGTALGLAFEVFGTVFIDLKRIFGLIMRPMLFISGLFFTIDMVPPEYRAFLLWNPVLHVVDQVRDAVLPGYVSPGSFAFVWAVIGLLLFIGLGGYRRFLYRLI